MQISEIQIELPFPDQIEMPFLECEIKSKYTCRFVIFYPSDRFQIPVKDASERDLTDDDQRIENFLKKNRIPDSGGQMELLFLGGGRHIVHILGPLRSFCLTERVKKALREI